MAASSPLFEAMVRLMLIIATSWTPSSVIAVRTSCCPECDETPMKRALPDFFIAVSASRTPSCFTLSAVEAA